MAVAKIVFTANPSIEYVISYKLSTDTTWIVPPGNPTSTSPFYIAGLANSTQYDFRVASECGITTVTETTDGPITFVWVEDTYTCEQDTPFTLVNTYTGFSSPQGIFWDQTSGRYYVVDVDDVNGNVWWFNPNIMTGYSDANHIAGVAYSAAAAHVFDPVNRKIWVTGDNTGGAHVLDIASDTFTTITYGTDGSGGSSQRSPIILGPTDVYAFSSTPNQISLYNRVTLALSSTIDKALIPSSSTYMTQSYGVTFVGSEAWVYAQSRTEGKIAIYDSTFSSLVATIDLPTAGCNPPSSIPGTSWSPNPGLYWQSHYYDASTNRWYVSDTGSSRILIIDTVTRTIVANFTISNKRDKDFAAAAFFKSQLTGEIFATVRCGDNAGDITANFKLYKINDSGITYIYPNEATAALVLRSGTNESWGVQQNLVSWQGGAWATDGLLFKYNEV